MAEFEPEETSTKISFFLYVLTGLITCYPSYSVLQTGMRPTQYYAGRYPSYLVLQRGIRPTQYYRQVSVLVSTRQVSVLRITGQVTVLLSTTDKYPSYLVY